MLWWLFFFFWVEKKGLNQGHDLLLADCWTFGGSNVTRAGGHWPPLLSKSPSSHKNGERRERKKNLFCTQREKDIVKSFSFYDLALLIVLKRRSCVKKYQPLTFFFLLIRKNWAASPSAFPKGASGVTLRGAGRWFERFKFRNTHTLCLSSYIEGENVTSFRRLKSFEKVERDQYTQTYEFSVPEMIFLVRNKNRFFCLKITKLTKGKSEFRLISKTKDNRVIYALLSTCCLIILTAREIFFFL